MLLGRIERVKFPWRGAMLLVLFALALRLGWTLTRPADDASLAALPDQLEYLQLGRNILAGNGLRLYDKQYNDTLYAFRAPGYPALVAACGGNVRAIRVTQAFVDSLTVLGVIVLARRWLPVRGALAAGAIVAINPYLVFFTGLVLTETLFITLLTWGMAGLVSPKRRWWWGGATLLVLSVHVRPGVLPVVLAVASQFIARPLPGPVRNHMPAGRAVVLLMLVALVPWAWRNQARLGKPVMTTTNAGFTLYDGFNPDADGSSDQALFRDRPELRHMSETERSDYLQTEAKRFVRDHPQRVVTLTLTKLARTWSPVPLSAQYGSSRAYFLAGLLYTAPLFALAFVGLWLGPIRRAGKVFLILPAIYLTLAAALSVGSLRYRVPADVPLAVLAASVVPRKQTPLTTSSTVA